MRERRGEPALTPAQMVEQGLIEYVPFPDALKGKYQSFTQADSTRLREAGYDRATLIEVGQKYSDPDAGAEYLRTYKGLWQELARG